MSSLQLSCQCYRCCSFHSNRNSGKETLIFTPLHTCKQKASVSIHTTLQKCDQPNCPASLTGPAPCSCSEPPGSHSGWRRGPATPAPRGRRGGARGSSGCSPPPSSPSRLCSARLDSLAPPGNEWMMSFHLSGGSNVAVPITLQLTTWLINKKHFKLRHDVKLPPLAANQSVNSCSFLFAGRDALIKLFYS